MSCFTYTNVLYIGLPDSKAWGKKRYKYYGGDVDDEDLGK